MNVDVGKGVIVAIGVGESVGTSVDEAVAITVGVSAGGEGVANGPCPVQPAIINNKIGKSTICILIIVRPVSFSLFDTYSNLLSGGPSPVGS